LGSTEPRGRESRREEADKSTESSGEAAEQSRAEQSGASKAKQSKAKHLHPLTPKVEAFSPYWLKPATGGCWASKTGGKP